MGKNGGRYPLRLAEHVPSPAVYIPILVVCSIGVFYGGVQLAERLFSGVADVPLDMLLLCLGVLFSTSYISFQHEKIWLFLSVILSGLFIFQPDTGDIGPFEIVYALFATGGLIVWYIKEVMIFRRKLVVSSFDLFLLTVWILVTVVSFLALFFFDGKLLSIVKEYLTLSTLMFYFPLRKLIRTRKDMNLILGMLAIIAVINFGNNIFTYQERVVASAIEYGAVSARTPGNEILGMVLVFIMLPLLAYSGTVKNFVLSLAGVALGFASITMSLSRGPIVATVAGMLALLVLIPLRKSVKLLTTITVIVFINILAVFIILPGFAEGILENVGSRLETLENVQVDRSLGSRIAESTAIITEVIPSSPILGYGFGVPFTYMDPLQGITAKTTFTHNGYLYPLYKFGLPVGLLFLGLLFFAPIRGVIRSPSRNSGVARTILAGLIGFYVAMLFKNLTSVLFYDRIDLLMLPLTWALLDLIVRGKLIPGNNRPALNESSH